MSASIGKPQRRKKANYTSYSSFIYKVLKQVAPDSGISKKAMAVVDAMTQDVFEKLATEASRLAKYNKKSTLTSREIQTAVSLIFPGELGKHAISEGTKAVMKFNEKSDQPGKRSEKAGLQFPVGRVHRLLKDGQYSRRVSHTAPIYLAAVLEYVAAEVLEISSNISKELKKQRITPRFLQLAIHGDTELHRLLGHAQITQGGVMPHIHSALTVKKTATKKRKPASTQLAY